MMELLEKLRIPLCQPQRIPVKTLVNQLRPVRADKKMIETHVSSMRLVSILNEQSIRIRPYKDDDYSYQAIYVFYIELKKDDSLITLSNLIHSAFPEPTILIYQRMNSYYVSLAEKRINKIEKDKTLVEEVIISEIPVQATDKQLSIQNITGNHLMDYYFNVITWLYKLKVLSITNVYPEQEMDYRSLLKEYELLINKMNKLKEDYKSVSMVAEKMKIDDELYNIEMKLKETINRLK